MACASSRLTSANASQSASSALDGDQECISCVGFRPLTGFQNQFGQAGAEGAPNAVITATGGSSITFNGICRVVNVGPITRVEITNTRGGACKTAAGEEPMRCLRVRVSSAGQVRMCDPAVTDVADPRSC